MFECFRIAKDERGFSKRFARGRDGAIDLIDRTGEAGAVTVAECKYIGSGAVKDVAGRWAEVFHHLWKNLPALREDAKIRPNSPYRAWLNPELPVKYYRFCVTVPMNDIELQAIEARIVADFAKLVALGVEEVRALAEGTDAVRVFRWDWFHAELEEHPSLAFRWFRGLPAGVELFESDDRADATFRDFLTAGELHYFSRDEYVAHGSGTVERGETTLTSRLADEGLTALLITGPGGVGKTRLSWELASALGKAPNGFDVYRLGRSAGYNSVTELADHYPGAASILLLIDYAEAAPKLGEIADAIAHVLANSSHRMRLIVTCRASATNWVSDSLALLDLERTSLGSVKAGEADFSQWVTRSILELVSFPEPHDLARICHGIPALAAFALFLFRRHRSKFDRQFAALHEVEDFGKWANRRIAALSARLGTITGGERDLARIALALPFPIDHDNALIGTVRPLLEALLADRWIEQDQGDYVAAHDVFADALVARWLFESDQAATGRAIDLLTDAASNGDLAHALFALARLAPHPEFGEISGATVADALIKRHPKQAEDVCNILLGGPLLKYEEKLDLLSWVSFIKDRIRDKPSLRVNLSILADGAAYRKGNPSDSAALTILSELLDDACNQHQQSNIVLRRAYAFDSQRFRERAWANVRAFPNSETTHFLLVQMLRTGESVESLRGPVGTWLDRNALVLRATFVYGAWLDASGGTAAVSEALLAWVAEHGTLPVAVFVFDAWLNAGGGTEAVSEALLAWVTEHGALTEAEYVYKAWLDAGGGTAAVADALLAWVAKHGTLPEAEYVYKAWLDAGGGTASVADALLAWVAKHGTLPEAKYVYKAWLDAGGGPAAVSEAMLAWVAEHGALPEAQFVYKAWLDAGGGTEAVAEALLAWVAEHGALPEAQFVYKAWLDAGGDFAAISVQSFRWSEQWCLEYNFAHLSKALSKRSDLPEPVVLAIGRWCAAFPDDEDALYRLGTLLAHLPVGMLSAGGISDLLRCIDKLFGAKVEFDALEKAQFWGLCVAVGWDKVFNFDPFGAARCVGGIVSSGKIFDTGLDSGPLPLLTDTQGQVARLVLFCLRQGILSTDRDYVALARFSAWLRSSTPRSGGILNRFITEFPSAAWS